MARTPSQMIPLGTAAPDFDLPDVDGNRVKLADFEGRPLLVMVICNHCPFVQHLFDGLTSFTTEYLEKGLAIVGINSNDVANYPDDAPEKMAEDPSFAFATTWESIDGSTYANHLPNNAWLAGCAISMYRGPG